MVDGRRHDELATLYGALKHDLYTVAFGLARERSAAEDAVHDVFASLARADAPPLRFATLDDARRYLVRACVHRVRDARRRRRPEPADDATLAAAPARDGDPLAHAAGQDEAARLRATLLDLPEEQREVVTLHLHGGLKFREVAELLAIPLDTATTRYRLALQKLARRLGAPRMRE